RQRLGGAGHRVEGDAAHLLLGEVEHHAQHAAPSGGDDDDVLDDQTLPRGDPGGQGADTIEERGRTHASLLQVSGAAAGAAPLPSRPAYRPVRWPSGTAD